MWRTFGLLACLVFEWSAAHPGCHPGGFPDSSKTASTFCPAEQFDEAGNYIQFGSCCTDADEDELAVQFVAAGALTTDCAELHKQVVCGTCHSFAGHLFEAGNGLTMKSAFCTAYTTTCAGQIAFASDYCAVHVGASDSYWSYPYYQDEAFADGFAEVFPGASLPNRAFSMQQSPDGSVYFIAGHTGEMKKIMADDTYTDPVPSSTLMTLTASGNDFFTEYGDQTDEGLNHFAFSPNFANNGYFYVSFNVKKSGESTTRNRLSKFVYNGATAGNEEVILESGLKISPYHPGGWVGFKPASYGSPTSSYHDIYWSTGDGSEQEDRENLAQDLNNLLGAMIRIQVPSAPGSSGMQYPSSGNYGGGADPAVCAIGFRNPWRCSFSPAGELYCGDVGQYKVEEVSKVECGKNYGWTRYEGSRCHNSATDPADSHDNGLPECVAGGTQRAPFTFPWMEYCHSQYSNHMSSNPPDEQVYTNNEDICGTRDIVGSTIIAGYWYRGEIFKDLLEGKYIFADYTTQNIYYTDDGKNVGTIISDGSIQVVSFTEDINGELMVLDKSGSIFHFRCGDLCPPPTICPEGGLTFDMVEADLQLAPGETCLAGGALFTFQVSAIGGLPAGYTTVLAVSDGVNTPITPDGGVISMVLVPDEGTTLTVTITGSGDSSDCNTLTILPECGATTSLLTVTSPELGDSIDAGTTAMVEFEYPDGAVNDMFDIELYVADDGDGDCGTLVTSICDTPLTGCAAPVVQAGSVNQYEGMVPMDTPPGEYCIRVGDFADETIFGCSGEFIIQGDPCAAVPGPCATGETCSWEADADTGLEHTCTPDGETTCSSRTESCPTNTFEFNQQVPCVDGVCDDLQCCYGCPVDGDKVAIVPANILIKENKYCSPTGTNFKIPIEDILPLGIPIGYVVEIAFEQEGYGAAAGVVVGGYVEVTLVPNVEAAVLVLVLSFISEGNYNQELLCGGTFIPVCNCAEDPAICGEDSIYICCKDKNICDEFDSVNPGACGDPHMTGFLGQKFDFTGQDGAWYSLIADDNMHVNMRVTTPVPGLPVITYITGLSVLTTDSDGFDHTIVIDVKDPHSLESSCPAGVSPCLADGSLTVILDGEEALAAPGTISLGEDVEVSAVNLPGACRSFGFETYWERKKLEYARHGRRLGHSLGMGEWILGDPTATNMEECTEYVAHAEEAVDGGLFAHQAEHASFQIVTPKATLRLSHGRLHQIAMRDPTDQFDLPDHLTWQMNMAVDHNEVSHNAKGVLGETLVPTRDANGSPIMAGMEAIRGTQEDYRVAGALGMDFVEDGHTSY